MVSKTTHYRRLKKARELGCSLDNLPDRRGTGCHSSGAEHYRWNRGRMFDRQGYVVVRVGRGHPLADPNGYCREHVLVWVAANGRDALAGREIHHRNGDKADNRLENLQALCHRAHMVADGRLKLTDQQVMAIRVAYASGICLYDLGENYGITMQTVSKIVRGEKRRSAGGPIEAVDHRVGTRLAGRTFDKREWTEFPTNARPAAGEEES